MKISIFHMKIRSPPRNGQTLHMKRRANYRKSPGALRSGRARSVVRSPLPIKRRPHQRSERLGSTGPPLLTRSCRLTTYARSAISASARRFPGFRARDRRSGSIRRKGSSSSSAPHRQQQPGDLHHADHQGDHLRGVPRGLGLLRGHVRAVEGKIVRSASP